MFDRQNNCYFPKANYNKYTGQTDISNHCQIFIKKLHTPTHTYAQYLNSQYQLVMQNASDQYACH